MYSEALKEAFFQDTQPSPPVRDTYDAFFEDYVVPMEQEYGEPFFDLPPRLFYGMVEQHGYFTYSSVHAIVKRANAFVRWYGSTQRNQYRGKTFDVYAINLTNNMEREMFFSEDELFDILHQYPIEDGYLDEVIGSMLWLGFEVDDMLNVQEKELLDDGSSMMIHGVEVQSDRMKKIFRYYRDHDYYTRGNLSVIKSSGPELIRRLEHRIKYGNRPINRLYIRNLWINRSYERPKNVSVIRRSGILYRMVMDFPDGEPTNWDITKRIGSDAMYTIVDWRADLAAYRKVFKRKMKSDT